MKKINFLFLVIYFFIASCGELLNDYNNKFGTKDLTKVFNPYLSYYSINHFGNSSHLMSFDFSTNTAKETDVLNQKSGDSFVVQKMGFDYNLEGVYFIERFSSTKELSRVTYLVGGKSTENANFPMNLHALAFVNKNIVGVGYDQGAIIQISPDLQKTLIPNTLVQNLKYTSRVEASTSSSNLSAILHENKNIFVLSQGSWSDSNVKPYIYQLDDSLLTVKNSWPISNCFNAEKYVNVIDSTKLVVRCNPSQNEVSNTANVFLIDISNFNSTGEPKIIKILEKQKIKDGFLNFDIGGVSADRNSIFISEKNAILNYSILNSYWYDLKNVTDQSLNEEARKTYVSNISDSVIYNYAAQKYLFSCVLDNETSTCQTGKGAVSSTMDGSDYVVVDLTNSKNAIQFPVLIFD